ncbi:MAG TPA: hypothetical protein VJH03_01680 [Blastocatellia bacterium]|nr:hypothetical protein [Blastocatellia bacterium]
MTTSTRSANRLTLACRILVIIVATVPASGAQIQLNKPKAVKPLPNPSILPASRDDVLRLTKQMLETREIPLDKEDCNQTTGECTLISKPVIFIKGITTRSQLEHYCEVPTAAVRNWVKGRYVLRVQVSPASPATSQVGVYARFEGQADSVTGSEWVLLTSKGELEDRLLRCILDRVNGGDCTKEETR